MDILVERYRNRIHLFCPWRPDIPERVKGILGWGMTKTREGKFKSWTLPLDWHTCVELRDEFKDELVVGPRLTTWANVEQKKLKKARRISKMTGIDLDYVATEAPALAAGLATRPFQQVGAAFLATLGGGLLADEPGLGKTLQVMAAVIQAQVTGPILVLAGQTALDITWQEELNRWLPDDAAYALLGSRAKRQQLLNTAFRSKSKRVWVLANYEMLRARGRPIKDATDGRTIGYDPPPWEDILDHVWASVVVDESQKLLITNSPIANNQSLQRQGAAILQIKSGGMKIAMSGTPLRGKTENLWGTLNWLNPAKYKSYNRWLEQWFEFYTDNATGDRILSEVAPQLEKRFYRELDSCVIRRTKPEVAPDMPPKVYAGWPLDARNPASPVAVWLDMTAEQRRAYGQMVQEAIALLDDGEIMANGVLAELTRLRQFSLSYAKIDENNRVRLSLPSNKFNWLVPWLAEREIEKGGNRFGPKVIIASQFSQYVDLVETGLAKLSIPTLKITGSVKSTRRKEAAQCFQDPKSGYRIMLLTTTAGGVSLTLDQADDVVIFDDVWDPDANTQLENRAHRIGRPDHIVTVTNVRSLGTIEEAIAADNESLNVIQHNLLDGRRGVARARQLLTYKSPRKLSVVK